MPAPTCDSKHDTGTDIIKAQTWIYSVASTDIFTVTDVPMNIQRWAYTMF